MSEAKLLEPGEKVIWWGKPEPSRYAFKKGRATFLVSAAGLAVIFFMARSTERTSELIGLLILALAMLFGLLEALGLFFSAERTTYAITERRAIIDRAAPDPERMSTPLSEISSIELSGLAGGIGDVIFIERMTDYGEGLMLERDGFFAVRDAEEVKQLLRSAVERAASRSARAAS